MDFSSMSGTATSNRTKEYKYLAKF